MITGQNNFGNEWREGDEEEWDGEEEWDEEEERSDEPPPHMTDTLEYEEPTPGKKPVHPPQHNHTNSRQRSESKTNLPSPPPVPNNDRRRNDGARRPPLVTLAKPSLPPPINRSATVNGGNSFAKTRSMFENVGAQQPAHIPDSPLRPRPSVPYSHQSSAPQRPLRKPETLPRGHTGGPRRPALPTGSSSDSRLVEVNGRERRRTDTSRKEDFPRSLETAIQQGLPHQRPSHLVLSPKRTAPGRMSTNNSGYPTAQQSSQIRTSKPQHPRSPRVISDEEKGQQPPDLPPPRTQGRTRPIAEVRPSPSIRNPGGPHFPHHISRSATTTTAPIEDPLHKRPWYHAKIDREEAERRLHRKSENGAFLIREGKDEQFPYVLSLIHNGHVYHTLVRKKLNGSFAAGKTDKPNEPEFESIEALVAHYRDHEIYVMGKQPGRGIECSTRLVVPADKPRPQR